MMARRGNPGRVVQREFTQNERVLALESFYKGFENGRYYAPYRMELNATLKGPGIK